jgi:predicted  nucleic acid-binding Zn-ribbon protein
MAISASTAAAHTASHVLAAALVSPLPLLETWGEHGSEPRIARGYRGEKKSDTSFSTTGTSTTPDKSIVSSHEELSPPSSSFNSVVDSSSDSNTSVITRASGDDNNLYFLHTARPLSDLESSPEFPRYGPLDAGEAWLDSSVETETTAGSDSAQEALRAEVEELREELADWRRQAQDSQDSGLPACLLFEAQIQREQTQALQTDGLGQPETTTTAEWAAEVACLRTKMEEATLQHQREVEAMSAEWEIAVQQDAVERRGAEATTLQLAEQHARDAESTQHELELSAAIKVAELRAGQVETLRAELTQADTQAKALESEVRRLEAEAFEAKHQHEAAEARHLESVEHLQHMVATRREEREEVQSLLKQHKQEEKATQHLVQGAQEAAKAAEGSVVELKRRMEDELTHHEATLLGLQDELDAVRAERHDERQEAEARSAADLDKEIARHAAELTSMTTRLEDTENAERAGALEMEALQARQEDLEAVHTKELTGAAEQIQEWSEAWSSERQRFREVNELASELGAAEEAMQGKRDLFESEVTKWEGQKEQEEEAMRIDLEASMEQYRQKLGQEMQELRDQLREGADARGALESKLDTSRRSADGEAERKRLFEALEGELEDSERRRVRESREADEEMTVVQNRERDAVEAAQEELRNGVRETRVLAERQRKEREQEVARETVMAQRVYAEKLATANLQHIEQVALCESVRARCDEEVRRRRQAEEQLNHEQEELREAVRALREQQEVITVLTEREVASTSNVRELTGRLERMERAKQMAQSGNSDDDLREALEVARTEAREAADTAARREEKYSQLKREVRDVVERAKADNVARRRAEKSAQSLREEMTLHKSRLARTELQADVAEDRVKSAMQSSKQEQTIERLRATLESEERIVQQLRGKLALRKYQVLGNTVG